MLFSDDPTYEDAGVKVSMSSAPFGTRIDHLGRYKMPLLPGERGPKAGGEWVPRGVQSATNLAGSIVESRMLGIWERERTQIGLALRPDLVERLTFLIHKAQMDQFIERDETGAVNDQRLDLSRLNDSAAGKAIKAELDLIHKEAKQAAGGNLAAQRGTNRHDAWEARGVTGRLFGTPEVNEQIEQLEKLLEQKGLERVPGLHERTVRNVALRAAGRFDDVLRTTREIHAMGGRGCDSHGNCIPAGTLLMSDLKTKQRSYYSWLEVRIQLAVYATAEWMLDIEHADQFVPYRPYVPGPKHHVNQDWGVILWAPSSGAPPQLKRANLRKGWAHAELARAVCDARSEAGNVAAHQEAEWPDA
jgi:hypothetical protein